MILKRKDKPKANYTVVSNSFLRDPSLSLKAKGMLSQLISLPTDWNVSIRGLQALSSDRMSSTRAALSELKDAGYISTERKRGLDGLYGEVDYVITDKAYGLHPRFENPNVDNRNLDNRNVDNRTQLNKEIQNKKEKNKEQQNCFVSPDKGSEGNGSGGAFEF